MGAKFGSMGGPTKPSQIAGPIDQGLIKKFFIADFIGDNISLMDWASCFLSLVTPIIF